MRTLTTDILVIGAGGAGLRAALSAHESAPDLNVTVISRGQPGHHGVTAVACSDRMAFHVSFPSTGPQGIESWRAHAMDIYAGGGYVSDPNLAELLARESADAYYRLADLGVAFATGPGNRPSQFVTDGSKIARACYTGPYTARDIEKALLKAVSTTPVNLLGNLSLAQLMTSEDDGRIIGALCISEDTDEWVAISARAAVIAAGGPGGIFRDTVFPDRMDASAWWAALRAGAALVNIEFIQFGLSSPATGLACSGSLMRALPRLCGDNDRDLLEDVMKIAPEHDPVELLFNKGASWPVSAESPTCAVDITVCRAVDRGENVRLDYSRNPDFVDAGYFNRQFPEIIKKWYIDRGVILRANGSSISPFERLMKINPQVIEWFRERGIDLQTEPVEVRHAAQHFQGGVLINTRAETSVPGLYACGEAAGGQHGANRPGGNALLDCQVMGHIAGIQAAQWASGVCDTSIGQSADRLIKRLEKEFGKENGFEPNEALRIVREFLSSRLGVIRTPGGLNDAINSLKDAFDTGVKKGEASRVDAVSARSAQVIGLALARAASMRRESRGAHLYFPNPDDVKPKLRKEPGGRVWNAIFDIKGEPKVKILKIPGLAK